MKPASLIVVGMNGNCLDIAETIDLLQHEGLPITCLGFLDDDAPVEAPHMGKYQLLGPLSAAAQFPDAHFINGIGSSSSYRAKPGIIARLGVPLERWGNVIHPTAVVSASARLGHGVAILANASVGADAVLGDHVVVLQNSTISHHAVIGDYGIVATGVSIAGGVKIGPNSYLGSNSSVRGQVQIGDQALIGMGSVVLRDVAAQAVVVGNPARQLKGRGGRGAD